MAFNETHHPKTFAAGKEVTEIFELLTYYYVSNFHPCLQETVTRSEWHDLFWLVHSVCLWDEKGPVKVFTAIKEDILEFIKQAQERVLSHQEDQALLKAYIAEWRKFFSQCSYLPMPFGQLESAMQVR